MRKRGSVGAVTRERIWTAAVNLIAEHGYEAVSMRDLAQAVGIKAASLYGYFSSKQSILFDIMEGGQRELIRRLQTDVLSQPKPIAQLNAFVRVHVEFFLARPNEVRVVYFELKSLTPPNRRKIIALRDIYEQGLKDILSAGCADGHFAVEDIDVTEKAILTMLSGVYLWYRPNGRLSQEKLLQLYGNLVLKLIRKR